MKLIEDAAITIGIIAIGCYVALKITELVELMIK
jgi:hypothetical protein